MSEILRKFFSIKLFAVAFCLAIISSSAQGEIYKWVNDKGETIYSEKKPQNPRTKVREIKPKGAQSPTLEKETSSVEEMQADSEPKIEERTFEDLEQKKENEVLRKENCEIAKSKIIGLQRPRVNSVDADGTRTRIGEDERQAQIDSANAAKEKWCN